MFFSSETLAAVAPGPLVTAIAPALEQLTPVFEVNTKLRRAHLVAQLAFESAGFSRMTENLNYRAERIKQVWPRLAARAESLAGDPISLANAAYAAHDGKDALGNGPFGNGNGWRYRGRGLIQITGLANYRRCGTEAGLDLVGNPDLAAEPQNAVRLALIYWVDHGCNAAADADDLLKITSKINPALEGLADRKALLEKAKAVMS